MEASKIRIKTTLVTTPAKYPLLSDIIPVITNKNIVKMPTISILSPLIQ
jgi:hypothetical protein